MATLNLPTADRRIEAWTTGEPLAFARPEARDGSLPAWPIRRHMLWPTRWRTAIRG